MGLTWSRAGTWLVAFVVGAVYGAAGTVAHGYRVGFVPVGLVLSIVGVAALLVAVRLLTGDRWAALAVGAGALAAAVTFSLPGPGGSIIAPTVAEGRFNPAVIWTIAVPSLVALAVVWPSGSRPGARPAAEAPERAD